MRFLPVIFLLFLSSSVFAAVEWSYRSTDIPSSDIAIVSGNAIFTSYDGKVYALSEKTGQLSWAYTSTEKLVSGLAIANKSMAVVASEGGKITFIRAGTGKVAYAFDSNRQPVSFTASDEGIYICSQGNITAFSHSGKMLWNYAISGMPSQMSYVKGRLYFTSGEKLYSMNSNGAINWIVDAENAAFFAPQEFEDMVYFGAIDNRLYSFNRVTGNKRWAVVTGGWPSAPAKYGSAIYFGSGDSYLYAIGSSGNLFFKYKAGGAIISKPAISEAEGRALVIFGANDGKLYAVDSQTGEEAWSFSAGGRAGSPVIGEGNILFSSSNGKIYSLSPSPVCSFSYPQPNAVVGSWLADFDGTAYSSAGIDTVSVRIKDGIWILAKGKEKWHAELNLSGAQSGEIAVECRARDKAGRQESGEFSSVSVIKSDSAQLQKIYVDAPFEAGQNESFIIRATDGTGRSLKGVSITIGSETKKGDSPFSVILGRSGNVDITLEKSGYETAAVYVKGMGGGLPLLPIGAGAALVAVIVYFVFIRKMLVKK